uniref:Odorant binding protein n=1 Tax=Semiothisa cinerearia TaxID=2249628 RepID=A0A889XL19_9NEOP|nr:odorant binding protein [Semiothisa cinerearia]
MKQLCWLLIVSVVMAAPPPMDEDMAELAAMVRSSCKDESGVDLALVEKVNAGNTLMDDGKLKCYIACVMETAGMMSDNEVDVEAVLALLDDNTRARNEKALRACGTQKGAEKCETAWKTQKCWQDANPGDYYLI